MIKEKKYYEKPEFSFSEMLISIDLCQAGSPPPGGGEPGQDDDF